MTSIKSASAATIDEIGMSTSEQRFYDHFQNLRAAVRANTITDVKELLQLDEEENLLKRLLTITDTKVTRTGQSITHFACAHNGCSPEILTLLYDASVRLGVAKEMFETIWFADSTVLFLLTRYQRNHDFFKLALEYCGKSGADLQILLAHRHGKDTLLNSAVMYDLPLPSFRLLLNFLEKHLLLFNKDRERDLGEQTMNRTHPIFNTEAPNRSVFRSAAYRHGHCSLECYDLLLQFCAKHIHGSCSELDDLILSREREGDRSAVFCNIDTPEQAILLSAHISSGKVFVEQAIDGMNASACRLRNWKEIVTMKNDYRLRSIRQYRDFFGGRWPHSPRVHMMKYEGEGSSSSCVLQ